VRNGLTLTLLALALAGCEPVAAPVTSSANPSRAGTSGTAAVPVGKPAAAPGDDDSASAALERVREAHRDKRLSEIDRALLEFSERTTKEIEDLRRTWGERIADLERENAKLHEEVLRQRRALEALQAASPLPNLAIDVPRIEGRVLSLERAADGPRVLLDVGKRQGVAPAYEFTIAHAGRAVAKIAIDRVEDEISSGRVVYAKDGETIREGDVATTRP
jgi:hypothetical protein